METDSEADLTAKCRLNIPILAVILVATLVSTASSIGGGMIMYFQGVSSLEEAMKEASYTETGILVDGVQTVFLRTSEFVGEARAFLFSTERVHSNTTVWAEVARTLFFSQTHASANLYYVSVQLHPYDIDHVDDIVQIGVWADLTRRGEREFYYGIGLGGEKNASGNISSAMVDVYGIDPTTQALSPWRYSFDNVGLMHEFATTDPRAKQFPPQFEDKLNLTDTDSALWAPANTWWASDGHLSGYTFVIAIFTPPAAPHPWSQYRTVIFNAGMHFAVMQKILREYSKRDDKGTSVLLVGRDTRLVYASTYEEAMVPTWCQNAKDPMYNTCYLRVEDLGDTAVAAFSAAEGMHRDEFCKERLDGEEFYLRMRVVHGGMPGMELIWFRSVENVNKKVQDALVLLAVFTVAVVLIDAAVAAAELHFIALPLRKLSSSIAKLGHMETIEAAEAINVYASSRVMLKETREVIKGMANAVKHIHEFRAFIPEAVLPDQTQSLTSPVSPASPANPLLSPAPRRFESDSDESRSGNSLESSSSMGSRSLVLHLTQRRVSLLLVNIVGWAKLAEDDDSVFLREHGGLVGAVLGVTTAGGGVLESFSGDRFFVGWNTVKVAASHAYSCARAANTVHQVLPSVTISCGMSTGKARVGNIGSKTVRRHSIISSIYPWVVLLEMYNKKHKLRITCDRAVFLHIQSAFHCIVVEGLYNPKLGLCAPVCEIVGEDLTSMSSVVAHRMRCNDFCLNVIGEEWESIVCVPDGLPREQAHFAEAHTNRVFVGVHYGLQRERMYAAIENTSVDTF